MHNHRSPDTPITFALKGLSTQQTNAVLGPNIGTNASPNFAHLQEISAAFPSIRITPDKNNRNHLVFDKVQDDGDLYPADVKGAERSLTVLQNKAKNDKSIDVPLVRDTITHVKKEQHYVVYNGKYLARERIVDLSEINPLSFYGANNSRLDLLKAKFSNAEILSRGTQIKIAGDAETVEKTSYTIGKVVDYIDAHGELTDGQFAEALKLFEAPDFT